MSLKNLHDRLAASHQSSLLSHGIVIAQKTVAQKIDSFNITKELQEKTSYGSISKILETQIRLKALADGPLKSMHVKPAFTEASKSITTSQFIAKSNLLQVPKLVLDLKTKNIFRGQLYSMVELNSRLGTLNRFEQLTNLNAISTLIRNQSILNKTLSAVNNISSILAAGERLRTSVATSKLLANVTLASAYRYNTLAGYFEAIEKQKQVLGIASSFDRLLTKKWAKASEFRTIDIEDDSRDATIGDDPIDKFMVLMDDLGPIFNTGEPPFKSTIDMLKTVKLAPVNEQQNIEQNRAYFLEGTGFYLRAYDLYYNKYVLYVLYLLLCLKVIKQGN